VFDYTRTHSLTYLFLHHRPFGRFRDYYIHRARAYVHELKHGRVQSFLRTSVRIAFPPPVSPPPYTTFGESHRRRSLDTLQKCVYVCVILLCIILMLYDLIEFNFHRCSTQYTLLLFFFYFILLLLYYTIRHRFTNV